MPFRRERPRDDFRRDLRLLDGIDDAFAARTGDPCADVDLTDFEETILFGVGRNPADPYPPAGHGYPRKR